VFVLLFKIGTMLHYNLTGIATAATAKTVRDVTMTGTGMVNSAFFSSICFASLAKSATVVFMASVFGCTSDAILDVVAMMTGEIIFVKSKFFMRPTCNLHSNVKILTEAHVLLTQQCQNSY
jgi:hypothetical protein